MDSKIMIGAAIILILAGFAYLGVFRGINLNSGPVASVPECESLPGLNKQTCYMEKAVEQQNPSICNNLGAYVKDECYQKVAAATGEISICEKIDEIRMKYYCYQKVAAAKADVSICEKILNEGKDDCYSEIAALAKDITICEKMANTAKLERCKENIAVKTADTSLCASLQSDPAKISCFTGIAQNTKDIGICDLAKGLKASDKADGKDYCLFSYATNDRFKEISICDSIAQVQRKDGCYLGYARKNADRSACEKIIDAQLRETCLNEVK